MFCVVEFVNDNPYRTHDFPSTSQNGGWTGANLSRRSLFCPSGAAIVLNHEVRYAVNISEVHHQQRYPRRLGFEKKYVCVLLLVLYNYEIVETRKSSTRVFVCLFAWPPSGVPVSLISRLSICSRGERPPYAQCPRDASNASWP